MKGILNGKLVAIQDLSPLVFDRATNYGDGLFETIIIKEGKIKFLEYHLERLHRGMAVLSIDGAGISIETIKAGIGTLLKHAGLGAHCRIKLQVWRESGGLYTPKHNTANVLISGAALTVRDPFIHTSGIAETIHLHQSVFSSCKTSNALPYILAGLEKKSRNLDEIIILDNHHNLSECSSSNIFWIKHNIIYTPSLESGCIAGIMRRHILHQAMLTGRVVLEVLEKPETLFSADQIFCCNVTGAYVFENFGGKKMNTALDPDIALWINQ